MGASQGKKLNQYHPIPEHEANYFRPNHYKWVIITNRRYDVRRKDIGFESFVDLDEVLNDARNVRMGVIALGAKDRDII